MQCANERALYLHTDAAKVRAPREAIFQDLAILRGKTLPSCMHAAQAAAPTLRPAVYGGSALSRDSRDDLASAARLPPEEKE